MKRAVLIVVAVTLAAFAPIAAGEQRHVELVSVGASDYTTEFDRASPDGTRAVFSTAASLTSDDTDGLCDRGFDYETGEPYPPTPCVDVYLRDLQTGVTKLVSTGPAGGSGHFDAFFASLPDDEGVSRDGKRVLFETDAPLVSQDTDTNLDFYSRDVDTGTTQLVSIGPSGGNGPYDVFRYRVHVSADGTRVFFNTQEPLVSGDTNGQFDAYVRDLTTGVTQVVSTGPGGVASGVMDGISADGGKAFFVTNANITNDDTDTCTNSGGCGDIYERDLDTGATTLVSTGPLGGQSGYVAEFGGTTPDGSRVWFHTAERLVAADTDQDCSTPIPTVPTDPLNTCVDVYERSGGQTTLISTSSTKNPADNASALFAGATADHAHVYFTTMETLVAADTDNGARDVYARENEQTILISDAQGSDPYGRGVYLAGRLDSGTVGLINPNQLFLLTPAQLLSADTDSEWDVYVKAAGTLGLATIGPVGGNGSYGVSNPWISGTGRLFFGTSERLTPDDPDASSSDVYQWYRGETSLISKGPTGRSAGVFVTSPSSIADGGRRFFFEAYGQLVAEDTNNDPDVYVSIADESPQCSGVKPDRALLWPPNRTFRTVTLSGATDPDGDSVAVTINGVTQDEPVGGSPDARAAGGDDEVRLRAERDPRRDGRVYRIAFEATDGHGGSCTGQAIVSAPRRRNQAAVDSAPPSYDSFRR